MTSPATPPSRPAAPTTYRLDFRPGLRLLGIRMILAAVFVVVAALLAGASDGGVVRVLAWVSGGAAALLVLIAVFRLIRPQVVISLDPAGYAIPRVPAAGVRKAAWTDVADVTEAASTQGRALVVKLKDGRTSTLPLVLVADRATELQLEVRERLDKAHGYRRLE